MGNRYLTHVSRGIMWLSIDTWLSICRWIPKQAEANELKQTKNTAVFPVKDALFVASSLKVREFHLKFNQNKAKEKKPEKVKGSTNLFKIDRKIRFYGNGN